MTRFPNHRPARLAGVEHCLEHTHRRGPSWPAFWRMLAMALVAFGVGTVIAVIVWRTGT